MGIKPLLRDGNIWLNYRNTPKSSILIGFSIIYKPSSYWGYPHLWKPLNITNVKYTKIGIKMPSIGWLKFGPKIKVSRSVGSFVQSKRWLKSVPKDKPWKTAEKRELIWDPQFHGSGWIRIIHQPWKGVILGWFPLLFGVMWLWSRYNSAKRIQKDWTTGKMKQNLQPKSKKLFIPLGSLDVSSAWLKLAAKVKLWRPAGNDTLLRFWLKSSPKVTCWRFEGKFTLSKLWLYLSPNVRLSRLLQVVSEKPNVEEWWPG